MDLMKYIKTFHDGNITEFARRVDMSRKHISHLANHGGPISRKTDKKIQKVTDGLVTAFDILAKADKDEG